MVNVAEDRNTPMEPSDEALCRRAADGSREAEEALKQHGIQIEADTLVPRIVNRTGDGLCPMETSVLGISDPAEARKAIERRLAELTAQKE